MADTRFIIETILRARDETARAMASARGNLEKLDQSAKETKRDLDAIDKTDLPAFRSTLRAIRHESEQGFAGVKKLEGAVKDLKDRDHLKLKPEMDFGQMKRDMDRLGLELDEGKLKLGDYEAQLKKMGGQLDQQSGHWERNGDAIKKWAAENDKSIHSANASWGNAVKGFNSLSQSLGKASREMAELTIQRRKAEGALHDDTGPNRLELAWGRLSEVIKSAVKAAEEGDARRQRVADGRVSVLRSEISAMEDMMSEQEVIAEFEQELHNQRVLRSGEIEDSIMRESSKLEKMRLKDIDLISAQVSKLDELQERHERISGDGSGVTAARIMQATQSLSPTADDYNRVDREVEKLTRASLKPELSERDREIAQEELFAFVKKMQRFMPELHLKIETHIQEFEAEAAEEAAEAQRKISEKEAEEWTKEVRKDIDRQEALAQELYQMEVDQLADQEAARHALDQARTEAERKAAQKRADDRKKEADKLIEDIRKEIDREAEERKKNAATIAQVEVDESAKQEAARYASQADRDAADAKAAEARRRERQREADQFLRDTRKAVESEAKVRIEADEYALAEELRIDQLRETSRQQRQADELRSEAQQARVRETARRDYENQVMETAKVLRLGLQAHSDRGSTDQELMIIEVESDAAMAKLAALKAAAEAAGMDQTVNMHADVNAAIAKLIAFEAIKRRAGKEPDPTPWQRFSEDVGDAMQRSGSGIAAFDNQVRGMVTLVIGAAIQPLITIVGALGGELIALGSSAAYAGAGLGGALTAGALQAIPALGLLASAIGQIKGVSDVMQQQDLLDQQKFTEGMKPPTATDLGAPDRMAGAQDAVKNAVEGVADAQDNLVDSQGRVKDAQEDLTEALAEAQRQYEDLMQAEINASIASRGAALSQQEAQKALDQALAEGRIEDIEAARLRLDEANQGVVEASTRARRAEEDARKARRNGIEGMPGVVGAKESLEAAEEAAIDAADGVDKAKRSLEGAKRGLDAAGASAASAGDDFLAAEGKLAYLTRDLTGAQREMLKTMRSVGESYRENILPLTDSIVEALTHGMKRADQIMNEPRFLNGIRHLSDEMGASINQLVNSFTDKRTMEQFLTIIAQARKNLGPLTKIIDDFGHALINIAVAADPVYEALLGWIGDLGERFRDVTSDSQRMGEFFSNVTDHMLAWLDLGGSVLGLFRELAQAGGADSGLTLVEAMTRRLREAAEWVERNQDSVRNFFADAREVMGIVAGVVWEIAKALARTFEPDKVGAFADILENFLIPALETAIELLGLVIEAFAGITNIPIVGWVMQSGLAFLLLFGILGKFFTLILPISAILKGLPFLFAGIAASGGIAAFLAKFGVIGAAIGRVLSLFGRFKALPAAITAAAGGAAATGAVGGAVGGAGAAAGAAGATAGKGFMSGFKGIVKKAGFIGVGLSALDGVITGFKTGSVENGIRDFASSLTFGLIDSTEERAEKSLARMEAQYAAAGQKIRGFFPGDSDSTTDSPFDSEYFRGKVKPLTPSQQNVPLGQDPRGSTGVEYEKSQYEEDLEILSQIAEKKRQIRKEDLEDKGFEDEQIEVMLDDQALGDSVEKSGAKLKEFWERVEGMRVNADKKNILFNPDTLIGAMKRAAKRAPEELRPMYEQMISEAQRAARLVERELKPEKLAIKFDIEIQRNPEKWKKITGAALEEVKAMQPEMRKEGYQLIRNQAEGMYAAGTITKRRMEDIKDIINTEAQATKEAAEKHTARLLAKTATRTSQWAQAVSNQMLGLTRQTNNILKKLGAGAIAMGDIGNIPGMSLVQSFVGGLSNIGGDAQGRPGGAFEGMPGERGKDAIPRMIGRGEAVLNWGQQQAINARMMGQDTIQSVVKRVKGWHAGGSEQPGMATGGVNPGLFDGHSTAVNSGIVRIVQALKRRFPVSVSSTVRPGAITASGNPSDHGTGDAVDISGSVTAMNAAANWVLNSGLAKQLKQGIYSGTPSLTINNGQNVGSGFFGPTVMGMHANHLHLAIAGAVSGAFKAVKTKLKKMKFEWPGGGAFDTMGKKQITKVRDALQKKIRKEERKSMQYDSAMPSGAGTEAPPGQVRKWLTAALKETGLFSPGNLNALYGRAMQESGGNPRAINLWDSNAAKGTPSKGLLQTIDPTFQAHMKKGMNDIWNPIHNAVAAIRYMMARYGHIVGPSGTGYFEGGRTPGKEGQPMPTLLHGDEHVISAKEVRNAPGGHNFFYALRRMLGGGAQGGSGGYAAGGRTLMVGDSLGVGMERALNKLIDKLDADNVGGRNSTQGLSVLKSKLSNAYKEVIFEMGTNDYTADMMSKNIKKAWRLVGTDRTFTVSTVRGREAKEKNEWLREFANRHSNVNLVRGHQIDKDLAGDGIHYSNYNALARAFAPGSGSRPTTDESESKKKETVSPLPWGRFETYDEDIKHEQNLAKLEERRREAEGIKNDEKQKKALDRIKELEEAEDKRHDRVMGKIEKVLEKEEARWDRISERQRQRMTVQHGMYSQRAIATPTDMRGIGKEIDVLWKAVENIRGKTLGSALRKFMFNMNELAGEGGLLDQMTAALEARTQDLQTSLVMDTFSRGFRTVRRGGERVVRATRDIRMTLSPERVARRELRNMERQGVGMVEVRQEERRALRKVENRIDKMRKGGIDDDERDDFRELKAAQKRISDKIRVSDAAIAQNLADRYAKQVEVFQAETEKRLKPIQRRSTTLARRMRVAEFMGNTGQQTNLMRRGIENSQDELRILQRRLKQAQKKGMTEYAEQLKGQIEEIYGRITDQVEALADWIISLIDKKAGRTSAFVGIVDRYAGVLDRAGDPLAANRARQFGAQVDRSRITTEMSDIESTLSNPGVVLSAAQRQALNDRLMDLTMQLAENDQTQKELLLATYELTASLIETRSSFLTGAFGGLQSIVTSLGGSVSEMAEILRGIGDALVTAGQGFVDNIMSNPAFASALTAGGINLNTTGQEFVDNIQNLLANWDTITAGMDPNTKALFMALIEQLIANRAAIADNTNQLEDLNGGDELQGFSSSSWTMFRDAIFNGLGDLLPQGGAPAGGTPQSGMDTPTIRDHGTPAPAYRGVSVNSENGSGDTIQLNVTNPTEMLDTTYVAARIAHAKKTRGR